MAGEKYPHSVAEALTEEVIENNTRFKLVAVYPEFINNGLISPDLHEDRERFAGEFGEDNVLTSFFIENGALALGLFIRRK